MSTNFDPSLAGANLPVPESVASGVDWTKGTDTIDGPETLVKSNEGGSDLSTFLPESLPSPNSTDSCMSVYYRLNFGPITVRVRSRGYGVVRDDEKYSKKLICPR